MTWIPINEMVRVQDDGISAIKQIDEDTVEVRYVRSPTRTLKGVTANEVIQKIAVAKKKESEPGS